VDSLRVAANWYSGWGTQPAAVNTGYDKAHMRVLIKSSPPFRSSSMIYGSENQLLNSKQSIGRPVKDHFGSHHPTLGGANTNSGLF